MVDEEPRSHRLSRRDLIKASALAGAGAWTAPLVIDSLSSPAAALSAGASLPCSWTYVFFNKPGDSTVYYTGISGNTCNSGSSNNGSPDPVCVVCNGVAYSMSNFGGGEGGSAGHLSAGGASCPGTTVAIDAGSSCSTFVSVNGTTVKAGGGATILAAFSHPSSTLSCACPGSTSPNNSITVCNTGNCAS
jgi:hypothetical protein